MIARGTADEIAAALSANGLILRVGVTFAEGKEAPSALSGAPARSALLVGQASPIRSTHGHAK